MLDHPHPRPPTQGHETGERHDLVAVPDIGATVEKHTNTPQPPTAPPRVDRMWARRLREDAQRPLSENLAEGIALSHVLLRYARDTPQR
jgi:hypothetical protein